MTHRRCKKCGGDFAATTEHFQPLKVRKRNGAIWRGVSSECRKCRNKRFRDFYAENREDQIARAIEDKRQRRLDPEYLIRDRTWSRESARRRFANLEERKKATIRNRDWRAANPYRTKLFKHEQPAMKAYRAMKRYVQKLKAMPSWSNESLIKSLYEIATTLTAAWHPHEVDHVYPLIHPRMCGLHVPWNLRVVPTALNQAKGNRLPFDIGVAQDCTALL